MPVHSFYLFCTDEAQTLTESVQGDLFPPNFEQLKRDWGGGGGQAEETLRKRGESSGRENGELLRRSDVLSSLEMKSNGHLSHLVHRHLGPGTKYPHSCF